MYFDSTEPTSVLQISVVDDDEVVAMTVSVLSNSAMACVPSLVDVVVEATIVLVPIKCFGRASYLRRVLNADGDMYFDSK